MQISFEQWGEARESLNIQIPWTIYHGLWTTEGNMNVFVVDSFGFHIFAHLAELMEFSDWQDLTLHAPGKYKVCSKINISFEPKSNKQNEYLLFACRRTHTNLQ